MTDEEGLAALARSEKLDQPMLERLSRTGLITCDDITTMDSQDRRVLFFIGFTVRGERILKEFLARPPGERPV